MQHLEKTRNRDVTNTSREGRVWKRTDEAVGQIDSVMGSETVATCFCFLSGLKQGGSDGKASAYSAGDPGLIPWVGKIPWRRQWHPTPVLLPRESHGWRSLVGYSPWGCKESDTTE